MAEPTAPQVSERTAERLNMLMRPAGGVSNYAFAAGILGAIIDEGTEEKRVAALAYVFANKPFARWSGPETPASEYPPPLDFKGRDRAEFEAILQDRQIPLRLISLTTQIQADEADVLERARRAWEFLAFKCPTPMAKVAMLSHMFQDGSPFLGFATPPTNVRFNEMMPEKEWGEIFWRNRGAYAQLNGIAESGTIKTKTATGAAVLDVLNKITDERERAALLGDYLGQLGQRSDGGTLWKLAGMLRVGIPIGELEAILAQIHAAGEKGEPCPACGKIHEKSETAHESE